MHIEQGSELSWMIAHCVTPGDLDFRGKKVYIQKRDICLTLGLVPYLISPLRRCIPRGPQSRREVGSLHYLYSHQEFSFPQGARTVEIWFLSPCQTRLLGEHKSILGAVGAPTGALWSLLSVGMAEVWIKGKDHAIRQKYSITTEETTNIFTGWIRSTYPPGRRGWEPWGPDPVGQKGA